ncbi:hypothetical protein [Marmoricola sp. RAF53]|uniref:hypothetical protein n=1 Tax=Marmoricola sp. RAF53 TaxID=3233059 RepID=UPI003F9CFDC9
MTSEPDPRDATLWSIYADFLDTICKAVLYAVIAAALAAIVAIVLGLGPVVFGLAMLAGLLGFLWPFNASARAARKRVASEAA